MINIHATVFFLLAYSSLLNHGSYLSYFASTYLLTNSCIKMGYQGETQLRFIHNWVITDRFHPVDGALVGGVCIATLWTPNAWSCIWPSSVFHFANSTFCQIQKSTWLFPYFAKFPFRVFCQLHLVLPNCGIFSSLATPLSFAKLWTFSSLATPLWQIGCQIGKLHICPIQFSSQFCHRVSLPKLSTPHC